MDLQLQGKVILVSGGASGVGGAIVLACAQEGAIPVVVDRDTPAAVRFREALPRASSQCEFVPTELASAPSCKAAVEFVLAKFRRLDALVNNAAIDDGIALASGSPGGFQSWFEHSLFHVYNLTHYALPALKQSRGAIVNIVAKTALTGPGPTSGSAAAEAAVLALTREWAVELLPDGIRVNAVVPFGDATPGGQSWLSTSRAGAESSISPGRRTTDCGEIAQTVAFLLSEKSSHTTGQRLFVAPGCVDRDR
ncbi:MAG TPA: SDR family oxidoreductase [Candidatus Acidoferrum sp.]|nr:SDR family oxidoreductase [Candidatus Acidoferrum sp.]